MSNTKRDYDSTIARMAGNIAAGLQPVDWEDQAALVRYAVRLARALVAEVKRTVLEEGEM